MNIKIYLQGDIVLAEVPYSTNGGLAKYRPAIIVSNNNINVVDDDVVIIPITSNVRNTPYSYQITAEKITVPLDKAVSEARCDKPYTIKKNRILGKLSNLHTKYLRQLIEKVKTIY